MRVRYPQAGTANAVVSLAVVPLDGARVDVDWRSDAELDGHVLEYLATSNGRAGNPLLTLLTRDQRRLEFREVDPSTGATSVLRTFTDDVWVELLPGTPRRLDDGRLLHSVDVGDTRRLWSTASRSRLRTCWCVRCRGRDGRSDRVRDPSRWRRSRWPGSGSTGAVELLSDPDRRGGRRGRRRHARRRAGAALLRRPW